ncbi:DUF5615 family PIN-like protein [Thermalbibacter longus]|uniref:DUF5615 family PIN-like protein n=1 Tax=Thermalbibacter longus TaxID=2951981 RepID=UPI00325F9B61
MMRLLANENVPAAVIDRLRELGHDVAWIRVENPGWPDRKILRRAATEDRNLMTFDKDFGALAFHAGLPASSGIVRLRLNAPLSRRTGRQGDRRIRKLDYLGRMFHRHRGEPHPCSSLAAQAERAKRAVVP